MSAVTMSPMLPVIVITKNDNSTYVFNPFLGIFDFRVQSLQAQPPVDSQGGTFDLNIVSNDASNAAMNTLLANISCGNKVQIYVGKTDSSKILIFTGMARDLSITEPNKKFMQLEVTGPDWWSDLAKNRICSFARIQKPAATGIGYDPTDTNATVGQIAIDLLTLPSSYTFQDITLQAQGVTVDQANIDPSLLGVSGTKVPQFIANFEKLDDKLSELDVWGSCIHYFDPDGTFHMRPAAIVPSPQGSWLFTDDNTDPTISTWAAGKVGYLAPNQKFKYTVENYKHRLIGTGGDLVSIDQKQETDSGSTQLGTTWLAIQVTPQFIVGFAIQIYVESIGIPTQDLAVMIVQDNGGKPTGQPIVNMNVSKSLISNTPGWVQVNVGQDYQVGNKYWIVLPGNSGYNGTNGYKWHYGGSTFTTATSPDGITWSTASGQPGYMYRLLTSTPLKMAIPGNTLNANDKVFHEEIYQHPFITDQNALQQYLTGLTAMTNFKKEILKGRVYAPDTVPMPFSNVLLRKISSGLQFTGTANYFILGQVQYNFQGGDTEATGTFWIDFQLVRFTKFP